MLGVLTDKRVLRVRRDGKRYVYRPAVAVEVAGQTAIANLLATFFGGRTSDAVAALLDATAAPLSDEELREIKRLATPVKYAFDPDMPESKIHEMLNKAQNELIENQQALNRLLKPLKRMIGKPAPKLTGDPISQTKSEIDQGKPTLLHFWATWCGPCKEDIPLLNKMAEKDWNIIGVHAPGTKAEEITSAVNDYEIKYSVLIGSDTKGVGSAPDLITGYPVPFLPYCVFINQNGNVEKVGTLKEILAQPERRTIGTKE